MNENNLSIEDWRLIKDCIVDQIFEMKCRRSWGYEEQVERLEDLLSKIRYCGEVTFN